MRQACVAERTDASGLNPLSVRLMVEQDETSSVGVRTYLHFCIVDAFIKGNIQRSYNPHIQMISCGFKSFTQEPSICLLEVLRFNITIFRPRVRVSPGLLLG